MVTFNVEDSSALAIFKTDSRRLNEMTEHLPDDLRKSDDSAKGTADSSLTPKDFFWDQMITVLVSAILGLTLLDIIAEFFSATGLQCYTPYNVEIPDANDFTRDRAAYVISYCHQKLPRGEFFTVFLLAHGIAIIAPHFLWSSLFGGKFDHFFGLVRELNRLRNLKTGQYDAKNFEIVRKLEKEYRQNMIYRGYKGKLFMQLLFSLTSFLLGVFFFGNDSFLSTFCCPNRCEDINATLPDDWPLETSLRCVYPLRYLFVLRNLDVALVGAAIMVLIYGLLSMCMFRYPTELGYGIIANFVNKSCLTADDYVTKPWLRQFPKLSPKICNDVEFLLMKVFHTDAGIGKVFKEILIQREINQLNREMSELLQMFIVSEGVTRRAGGI